jgi:hypothetical protein
MIPHRGRGAPARGRHHPLDWHPGYAGYRRADVVARDRIGQPGALAHGDRAAPRGRCHAGLFGACPRVRRASRRRHR